MKSGFQLGALYFISRNPFAIQTLQCNDWIYKWDHLAFVLHLKKTANYFKTIYNPLANDFDRINWLRCRNLFRIGTIAKMPIRESCPTAENRFNLCHQHVHFISMLGQWAWNTLPKVENVHQIVGSIKWQIFHFSTYQKRWWSLIFEFGLSLVTTIEWWRCIFCTMRMHYKL